MTRKIHCLKLNKDADGLDFPPLPGELGNKIYENISKEAWQQWQQHQTATAKRRNRYGPGRVGRS